MKKELVILILALLLIMNGCKGLKVTGKAGEIIPDVSRDITDNGDGTYSVTLYVSPFGLSDDDFFIIGELIPDGASIVESLLYEYPSFKDDNSITWLFANNPPQMLGNMQVYSSIPTTISYTISGTCNSEFRGKFGLRGDELLADSTDGLISGETICPSASPEISTCQELQDINDGLNGDYILIKDIDCSETSNWNYDSNLGIYKGFEPIALGSSYGEGFKGSLDGQNFVINNLYINNPYEDSAHYCSAGLFCSIESGAEIRNIGLEYADITGNRVVGGLVGINYYGSVINSYVTGIISGASQEIGGLVGYNNYGTIADSYFVGEVEGDSSVGGIAGYNMGTISKSFLEGEVRGSNSYVGGIVGSNRGTIEDSYSRVDVDGYSAVGGVAGDNSGGSVRNSYSTGDVSGMDSYGNMGSSVGGLVGYEGSVTNSYYDETANIVCSYSCNSMGSESFENMISVSWLSAQGWDFSNIWEENPGNYPVLRMDAAPDNPYEISTCDGLQNMNNDLDGDYRLVDDVYCSGFDFEPVGRMYCEGGSCSGYDCYQEWGCNHYGGTWITDLFTGTFDGQGYAINDLQISSSKVHVGLFGYTEGSTVSDVGLENVDISGGSSVGAVVGLAKDTTISKVYSTGTVRADEYYVGGIAGRLWSSSIHDSYSRADVSGNSDEVGGIVGYMEQSYDEILVNVYATGDIIGNNKVGGLVGETYSEGEIKNSFATGSVTKTSTYEFDSDMAGGLIGLYGQNTQADPPYEQYPATTVTNSYWYIGSSDSCAGDNPVDDCYPVSSKSDFYGNSHSVYSNWDFTNTWQYNPGDYPTLI